MPTTALKELQCGTCGVWHAIPQEMHDTCVEEGGYWHCPNGHSRGYREGRKEREAIRRERDQLKQKVAELEDTAATARKNWYDAVRESRAYVAKAPSARAAEFEKGSRCLD